MLWILPQQWNSWCIRLITHLYFLLMLHISAFVTVLPLYVFMVCTGTILSFTVILEEWLQYLPKPNSVPQKMRMVWSHGTLFLFSSTVLCQNRMLLSDDLYPTGMLGNLCSCGFSFYVMLFYWIFMWPFHVFRTHRNFLSVFPKVQRVWHALAHTGHDIWHLLKWVQMCFQFRILSSTIDDISFTDTEEERPVTIMLSRKLCICQKCVKSFGL